jgi:hypothetical protein
MTPVKIGMHFGVTYLNSSLTLGLHLLPQFVPFSLSLSLSIYIYIYIYIVVPKCGTGLQQDFLTLCAVVLLDQLSLDVEHQAHCCTNLQTSNQGLWFCNQQMGNSQA